jgi:alpha-mannosidase
MMILFGLGDHGGGPTEEILCEAEKLNDIFIYPQVKYGTAEDYINRIVKEVDIDTLPVWRDELYLEYHRGTYTTQARAKYNNRKSEVLLVDAEKISTLAHLYGNAYPNTRLAEAWEKAMFNQFHDILPGSSIRSVYQDSEEDYAKIRKTGEDIIKESLDKISSQVDTSGVSGQPVVVFNPLFWPREEIVSIPVSLRRDYVVRDSEGNKCLSQKIEEKDSASNEKKSLLLCKTKLPSFGYTTLFIEERKEAKPKISEQNKGQLKVDKYSLENEFFKVEVNPATGNLASIYDKKKEHEVLAGEGNQLQILEEKKSKLGAWNITYTGRKWLLDKVENIEVIEKGPLRGVIRVRRSFLGDTKLNIFLDAPARDYPSSFFIQDIILYQGVPRIDYVTQVDWWEDNKLLKVAFPVRVKSKYAAYEIPFGSILRPTTEDNSWEKARFEVPVLRWADLSEKEYGIALLNESKYGYDIHGNTIRLTLLRSPASDVLKSSSVPDPLADRGKHTIRYSLIPHPGNWKEALVYRKAYEFNFNPYVKLSQTQQKKGNELPEKSFLKVKPDNVVLTAFKQAEKKPDHLILRVCEMWGQKSTVEIELPLTARRIFRTNLIEEDEKEIGFDRGNRIRVDIRAYEILTLRICPE